MWRRRKVAQSPHPSTTMASDSARAEAERLARLGTLQEGRPTLATMVSGALRGDAKSLYALENIVPDAAILAEAMLLLCVHLGGPAHLSWHTH